jgi:hypothetical protein
MHVESFSSTEEMVEYLRANQRRALAGLAPQQRAIRPGDYWVQFHNIHEGHLIWGRVWTPTEVALGELTNPEGLLREDVEWSEVITTVAHAEEMLEAGLMYGMAYDRFNPGGELGTTHKAHVWPIEERLFMAAAYAGYDHREIKDEAMRLLLDIAFRAIRAHVIGKQS